MRLTAPFCGRAQWLSLPKYLTHRICHQFGRLKGSQIFINSNRESLDHIIPKKIKARLSIPRPTLSCGIKMADPYCARCREPFARFENIAQTGPDEYWHLKCFVCSHCFKPFDKNLEYYEKFGRKYCKQDFLTLFAPCCARCHGHITAGRCIHALNKSWHPECFQCDECEATLSYSGFVKSINHDDNQKERALCYGCHAQLKKTDPKKRGHVCFKCKAIIDDEPPLVYGDETYHAYHFNCHSCGIELKHNAHLVNSTDLYCQRCHDTKLDIPICDGCRKPIERERYVTALGKQWHLEHFACAGCEKPFHGKRYFELNGSAYCSEQQDCCQHRFHVK